MPLRNVYRQGVETPHYHQRTEGTPPIAGLAARGGTQAQLSPEVGEDVVDLQVADTCDAAVLTEMTLLQAGGGGLQRISGEIDNLKVVLI